MNRPPTFKAGGGSLLNPPGPALCWDRPLLDALEQCIRAELTVAEISRRMGIRRDGLARGAMILLRYHMTGERRV
jgi:hypothetical protein